MNEEPSGKFGPMRLKMKGGRVSGVSIIKLRCWDLSMVGSVRTLELSKPDMTSCNMIPPALLTMLLPCTFVVPTHSGTQRYLLLSRFGVSGRLKLHLGPWSGQFPPRQNRSSPSGQACAISC